ncbi:MAG: sulfatase-like hydrolase/transferase [Dehalococcoidia bacterium]|nr:sulfatase-like hydrolase/transferase [Dehalococcoidia bacterium]
MAPKPNVLFICSDQQRTDTMGAYGNDWIETPALNALAERSFIFENAYVTQPVCSPARSTMMTGLYPHSAGVVRNSQPGRPFSNLFPGARTIAEMVSDEYVCAKYGKWHLGDDLSPQHGFTEWVSTEDAHDDNYPNWVHEEHRHRKSDYFKYLVEHGYEPEGDYEGHKSHTQAQRGFLPEEHTMAAFLSRNTVEFINEHADDSRPWLMYVNMFEPHPPYNGPLNDLYDPASIPVGPLFLQKPAENTPVFNRARADFHIAEVEEAHPEDPARYWRELRARYFGNVTVLDRGIGPILSALHETGQADNTIVVFTSDHGDSLGDRGMLNKRAFYDEVARVPLLVHVPWLSGGMAESQRRIGGSIGQVDLVPTLLDLMGEEVPGHLQGSSRRGVLEGRAVLDDNVFMQWHGGAATVPLGNAEIERLSEIPWRCVVSGDRWKLNLSPGDLCELYDLNDDPLELTNLYDHPVQADRIRNMTKRIQEWQEHTGDELELPVI